MIKAAIITYPRINILGTKQRLHNMLDKELTCNFLVRRWNEFMHIFPDEAFMWCQSYGVPHTLWLRPIVWNFAYSYHLPNLHTQYTLSLKSKHNSVTNQTKREREWERTHIRRGGSSVSKNKINSTFASVNPESSVFFCQSQVHVNLQTASSNQNPQEQHGWGYILNRAVKTGQPDPYGLTRNGLGWPRVGLCQPGFKWARKLWTQPDSLWTRGLTGWLASWMK